MRRATDEPVAATDPFLFDVDDLVPVDDGLGNSHQSGNTARLLASLGEGVSIGLAGCVGDCVYCGAVDYEGSGKASRSAVWAVNQLAYSHVHRYLNLDYVSTDQIKHSSTKLLKLGEGMVCDWSVHSHHCPSFNQKGLVRYAA